MELLGDRRFHLAILDVDLNGESGLDLLNHFKSKYAEMAVMMFSGRLDEELPKKALAAGANGFMRKREFLHDLLLRFRDISL